MENQIKTSQTQPKSKYWVPEIIKSYQNLLISGDIVGASGLLANASQSDLEQNNHGYDLVHSAVRFKHIEGLYILFERGVKMNGTLEKTEDTALHSVRDCDIARFLVEHGVNPNSKNKDEWTPSLFFLLSS